jgi:hypothetical protein
MTYEYLVQMQTVRTPGRYILRGRFTAATDATQWATDNRDSYGITHAEIWRSTVKNTGKLYNLKMLAEVY